MSSAAMVAFVQARLDDAERDALAATSGPWQADGGSVYVGHPVNEVVSYTESAAHIARQDPARTLREIAAKRELLSRYEAMAADVLVMTGVEVILSEYRRAILPGLALPYADHPDYQAACGAAFSS